MHKFVSTKTVLQTLEITPDTLRRWESNNQIESIRTPGNTRLYNLEEFLNRQKDLKKRIDIIYCRVSSRPQKPELQNQINFLRDKFPNHVLVTDIASGLNYKRKGLQQILEYALSGSIGQVMVAHRDRLCRFGFELIDFIIKKAGGEILVQDRNCDSPEQEMVKDITSIIHVFSCRLYGLRKYKKEIKKDETKGLFTMREPCSNTSKQIVL
jgi:predicted site-specific integrase-resolvase